VSEGGVKLDANDKAAKSPSKSAAIGWPYPLDRRLDQLVDLANEVGANTRRNELAAALIAAGPTESADLLKLVLAWRVMRVRDVVLDVGQAAQVIDIPVYRPGRRRAIS
jgi:hypothetical protein